MSNPFLRPRLLGPKGTNTTFYSLRIVGNSPKGLKKPSKKVQACGFGVKHSGTRDNPPLTGYSTIPLEGLSYQVVFLEELCFQNHSTVGFAYKPRR